MKLGVYGTDGVLKSTHEIDAETGALTPVASAAEGEMFLLAVGVPSVPVIASTATTVDRVIFSA